MRGITVAALMLALVWPVVAGAADSDIEAQTRACVKSCRDPYPSGMPATTRATPAEKEYMACAKACADVAEATQARRDVGKARRLRAERMRREAALNAKLDAMVQEIADYRRQAVIERHWARNEQRFRKRACPLYKNPERCRRECDAGNPWSCMHLAKDNASGYYQKARATFQVGLYQRACNLNLGAGCLWAAMGQWQQHGFRSVDRQLAGRGLALAIADCNRGVAESCLAVGEWKIKIYREKFAGASLAYDAAGQYRNRSYAGLGLRRALSFHDRACHLGAWSGCLEILYTHSEWDDYPKGAFDLGYTRVRLGGLVVRACRSGDPTACRAIFDAVRLYKIPIPNREVVYAKHILCTRTRMYWYCR